MDHRHPQQPHLILQIESSPFKPSMIHPLSHHYHHLHRKLTNTGKRTLKTNPPKKTSYLSPSPTLRNSSSIFISLSFMRRKCRKIGEIAVMELSDVALRTRAMASTGIAQKKRRRVNGDGDAEFRVASSTASYIQLRSQRILVDHSRVNDNRCLSPNLDHDDDVSCCSSSIGSSEKRIIQLPDLEEGERIEVETSTHLNLRERRETTPSSELRAEPEDLDSTSRPSEANSRRRSTVEKMPTEAELEEFFAASEKKVKKQFAEKYNYDIVKDKPLEGRYQWVRFNP